MLAENKFSNVLEITISVISDLNTILMNQHIKMYIFALTYMNFFVNSLLFENCINDNQQSKTKNATFTLKDK